MSKEIHFNYSPLFFKKKTIMFFCLFHSIITSIKNIINNFYLLLFLPPTNPTKILKNFVTYIQITKHFHLAIKKTKIDLYVNTVRVKQSLRFRCLFFSHQSPLTENNYFLCFNLLFGICFWCFCLTNELTTMTIIKMNDWHIFTQKFTFKFLFFYFVGAAVFSYCVFFV